MLIFARSVYVLSNLFQDHAFKALLQFIDSDLGDLLTELLLYLNDQNFHQQLIGLAVSLYAQIHEYFYELSQTLNSYIRRNPFNNRPEIIDCKSSSRSLSLIVRHH